MGGIVEWIGASRRRMFGVVIALLMTLAIFVALIFPFDGFCDGSYEAWRLPDYRGGGCPTVTPAIHGIFPWNWDADRTIVCTGLCPDSLTPAP